MAISLIIIIKKCHSGLIALDFIFGLVPVFVDVAIGVLYKLDHENTNAISCFFNGIIAKNYTFT